MGDPEIAEELNRLRYIVGRVSVQSINACRAMGKHHPAGVVGDALAEVRALLLETASLPSPEAPHAD